MLANNQTLISSAIMPTSRIAVITGSSSGLGAHLSKVLHSLGWDVYGIDKNSPHPSLKDSIKYYHFISNLSDYKQIDHTCSEICNIEKKIDLLVNCAGVMPSCLVAKINPLAASEAFLVNTIAPIYIAKKFIRPLRKSIKPIIINITSIAAELSLPGECIYGASKAALKHASESMAIEFIKYGITVHNVAPALINTPLTKHLTEKQENYMLTKQALDREVTLVNFSDVILHLLTTPLATTGSTTYVGGINR